MLTIEKLSEKNLKDVLTTLFPTYQVESQKRFKTPSGKLCISDYYIDTGLDQ